MSEQGFPEAGEKKPLAIWIPVSRIIEWLKKLFSSERGKWGWR